MGKKFNNIIWSY